MTTTNKASWPKHGTLNGKASSNFVILGLWWGINKSFLIRLSLNNQIMCYNGDVFSFAFICFELAFNCFEYLKVVSCSTHINYIYNVEWENSFNMFEILNILIKLLCLMMKLFVCKEPLHVTRQKETFWTCIIVIGLSLDLP